jgi:hypothetical protein
MQLASRKLSISRKFTVILNTGTVSILLMLRLNAAKTEQERCQTLHLHDKNADIELLHILITLRNCTCFYLLNVLKA